MFSLVEYNNADEIDVVPSKTVIKKGDKNLCSVKHRAGRYEAKLLVASDDKKYLFKLKTKRRQSFMKAMPEKSEPIFKHPAILTEGKQNLHSESISENTSQVCVRNTFQQNFEIFLKPESVFENVQKKRLNITLSSSISNDTEHVEQKVSYVPSYSSPNTSKSILKPVAILNEQNAKYINSKEILTSPSEHQNIQLTQPSQQNLELSSLDSHGVNRVEYLKSPCIQDITSERIHQNRTDISCLDEITTEEFSNTDKNLNVVHNSTENSNFSQCNNTLVTNESFSEYLPDTTNDEILQNDSSNFENACNNVLEKSVDIITSPVDIRKVEVPYSSKTKKYFCVFCNTMQTKLVRHFLLKHKKEEQVKKFSKLPNKHKDRLQIISQLRKEGCFLHNTNKSFNTGILIVSRQQLSNAQNEAEDYVCCKNCKGFFSKRTLRKHMRRCGRNLKNERTNFASSRKLTQYIHEEANKILRTLIFPPLRTEEITNVIRYDELIIKYGNKLAEKYTLVHQHEMVRSQLRLLGRFKIAIKELCPEIEELKEIYKPQMFDNCVKALRIVAKWDETLMWFQTPSVATYLTSLIKKCGNKQRTEFIKMQDEDAKKNVDDFLLLWEEEIPTLINKKAFEDQANQKRDKKIILPSREDIKKLYNFLKNRIMEHIAILEQDFCQQSWTELIKHTLIFIQIFNRRRAGEIERLKVINYNNRELITDCIEKDLLQNISHESLEFAKQYARLNIRGKLGRTVCVLLSPLAVSAIDTILKYREVAGISEKNEFIFCKNTKSKLSKEYFRACPLLKQFATECGAEIPESLRGTTLRKHIATYTSLLNIEDAAVDKLANFMGHHKDIHKNVYRMSVPAAEITCISKLLTSAIGDDNDDEICENDGESSKHSDDEISNAAITSTASTSFDSNGSKRKKRSTSPFGKTKRSRWVQEEIESIQTHFGCLKNLEKLPSISECLIAIKQNDALKNRTPQQVKTWIDNQRRYK